MSGFQCKRFYIGHELCAMKVGTDSLILGSAIEVMGSQRILDIGTGSGLLALMMAQKSSSTTTITAIDIEPNAVAQTKLNVAHSPWPEKVQVSLGDICHWQEPTGFDLIVTNPPYFESKRGPLAKDDANYMTAQRRTARQTHQLDFEQLLLCVTRLLDVGGRFYCVVPLVDWDPDTQQGSDPISLLAQRHGLHCIERLHIAATPSKHPRRVVLGFSRSQQKSREALLVIRDQDNQYTVQYRDLCKDFYLNF